MEKIQLDKIKDYKYYYKKYHNLTSKQLIKFRKEDLQMTQSEFAKLMGYYKSSANSYICQLEKGYVKIPKHFALVCNLLKQNLAKEE